MVAMSDRACGECKACCYVLKIIPLNKEPLTHCEHECDQGCSIYETRPDVCRGYECLWLDEDARGKFDLKDNERPDKIGLLFQMPPSVGPAGVTITCHEIWEGASKEYWGEKVLKRLRKRHQIAIVWTDEHRRLVGPAHRLRKTLQVLQSDVRGVKVKT